MHCLSDVTESINITKIYNFVNCKMGKICLKGEVNWGSERKAKEKRIRKDNMETKLHK